jgi:hypothetical protein
LLGGYFQPFAPPDPLHPILPTCHPAFRNRAVKAGLPPKVLVAKIDRSPGNFDTSPDVLKQLKEAGVHDSIILAMVRAS